MFTAFQSGGCKRRNLRLIMTVACDKGIGIQNAFFGHGERSWREFFGAVSDGLSQVTASRSDAHLLDRLQFKVEISQLHAASILNSFVEIVLLNRGGGIPEVVIDSCKFLGAEARSSGG